ncbi:unnamed protein product (mitochondrion) [Plasmodiophora brassicae]|uniref:Dienelactone hydrolase domain-containing protein n=1 Tax=Plasmodiophora brassicae TaxID=37360 RepID=A0A3P3YKK7_PLABS|nr:unnamed protein product [Plasmodiophora brassicae]
MAAWGPPSPAQSRTCGSSPVPQVPRDESELWACPALCGTTTRIVAMSCCPPDSAPYLAADYKATGRVVTAPGTAFEHYVVGDGTQGGILVVPDVYGWNGGRVRNIADWLASRGFVCVVTKLLVPTLGSGTDGDGFPGDFDTSTFMTVAVPYLKTISWDGILKPRLQAAISILKMHNAKKIAAVGFCWGGWVIAKAMADADLKSVISCSAIAHPSIARAGQFVGEGAQPVVSKITVPVLLMPAGNDPDEYRPGGAIYETLKRNNSASTTTDDFRSMTHGWMPRGDLKNPEVKKHVDLGLQRIIAFVQQHMQSG